MRFWLLMLLICVGTIAATITAPHGDLIFLAGYLVGLCAGYAAYKDAAKVRQGGAE